MVSADVQLHAQCLKHILCYSSSSHSQDMDPNGGAGNDIGTKGAKLNCKEKCAANPAHMQYQISITTKHGRKYGRNNVRSK